MLKQEDTPEPVAAELLGHSSYSISFDRYGKKYPIETLAREVEKLQFKIDICPFELPSKLTARVIRNS